MKKSSAFGKARPFLKHKERIMTGLCQSWQPHSSCHGLVWAIMWSYSDQWFLKRSQIAALLDCQCDCGKSIFCFLEEKHVRKHITPPCYTFQSCIYVWYQDFELTKVHMSQDPETSRLEGCKDTGIFWCCRAYQITICGNI